jgi:ribonuclease H2 subunit A
VKLISAQEISEKMLKRAPISLNAISHDAAMELVSLALQGGVQVTKVIVDTVGDPVAYQRKLTEAFDHKITFVVEKKADANFKVVGAASIAAKVLRDQCIEQWHWKEKGIDFPLDYGSGYPSDPKTCEWLRQHQDSVFGYPSIVRFSWAPIKQILEDTVSTVDLEWSEDEDQDDSAKGTVKLTTFFQATKGPGSSKRAATELRNKPFKERKLTLIDSL